MWMPCVTLLYLSDVFKIVGKSFKSLKVTEALLSAVNQMFNFIKSSFTTPYVLYWVARWSSG